MHNGICYVIGAGENHGLDFTPTAEDFVIAADAGLCYTEKADIRTDLVIGDFDTQIGRASCRERVSSCV